MSPASASTPLLAAQSLTLERGGRELFRDLSFTVLPGQLWQVEGENGAGKTSLMRILAGLSRYGFDGAVTRTAAPLYLGHHAAVKALLTPRENLRWHVSGEEQYSDTQIDAALEQVGLFGYEDVASHMLSAGQHRRVNLARLFLSSAPLWLLDEPFAAIDAQGVAALEARIEQQVADGGAVVVISHQLLQVACPIHRVNFSPSTFLPSAAP